MRKEGDKRVEVKLSAPLFIPEITEKNLLKTSSFQHEASYFVESMVISAIQ